MIKILIIEDSEDDSLLLVHALKDGGLDFKYKRVEDHREMNDALIKEKWDAVISDYSLLRFSIQEALELLRRRELDIPFIVVSGVIGEEYVVELFKAGAHDLIRKGNLVRMVPALKRELNDAETRRKQRHTEKELLKSEEKYKSVFENTGTATVIVEKDSIILLANSKFETLSGFSREEIEGKKTWTEFVVKEDLARMKKQHDLKRKNREKALKSYEFRFVDKNKEIKNIFLTIDMIPGTTKSVASLSDITERKEAENKLKEKMSVLERFNRLTVGRELRMIELKKEINELLRETGRTEKYKISSKE